ncbi:hypothetical protein M422DRAFT_153128 [Sphaerobolus stellatus SS14]|nr:hypothetical protein M422DRAFT_153128 [Sphaerobolus stellatus SS14]
MRRVASKVHHQISRFMEAGLTKTPVWYAAVMDHPPLPLPPRAPTKRTEFDLPEKKGPSHSVDARHIPSKHLRTPKNLPRPIEYLEDRVRKQFFKDRPFQAFRAISLVEDGSIEKEHEIKGEEWTRLSQRGRNPYPEDAVRFTVHLHTVHGLSLMAAYRQAVLQYDALRSEQYIMNAFAALEAESYGATFASGEVERGFKKESEALKTWEAQEESDHSMNIARKKWRATVHKRNPGEWTHGQAYVRLWKEGVRPDYTPLPIGGLEAERAEQERRLLQSKSTSQLWRE